MIKVFFMRFCFIFLISFLFIPVGESNDTIFADTTYWTINVSTGLNFNQVSFSKNWKSGGNNSVSISGLFNGKTDYNKGKIDWVNNADLQYGKINNEGQGIRKSVDKIQLDSKFGYAINKKWNAFSSLSFLSQFDDGFVYFENDSSGKISGFMAPAFITSSWGVEYKPNEVFNIRISPFSPRITLVNDTALYHYIPENYGVQTGKTVRYEWKAFKLSASYENKIVENINIKSKYELFASLDDFKLKNTDHRLDLLITAKIYKFLNLTLNSNYLYDIDQDKNIQSSILIGLSFLLDYKNQ